ncbi:MAG: SpoIIE family protein phosphatase [Micromonosporaceae bacterium]
MGALSQPPHSRLPVRLEEDVGAVRRAVGTAAARLDGIHRGRPEIVATELATNIIRHAAGAGYLLCQAGGNWLDLLAVDHGPGLSPGGPPPTAESASPEYRRPRAGGLGVGLAAVGRLASAFDSYSGPGGTVILARFGDPQRVCRFARWGGVSVPLGGAGDSGDGWAIAADGCLAALVVDGLGHGAAAGAAAEAAVSAFGRQPVTDPAGFVLRAHQAMRSTRGGVLAACVIDPERDEIVYAGVGNIAGRMLTGPRSQGLLSHEGTLGTQLAAPDARVHRYRWSRGATLVLASDGVSSRWDPASYPGLFRHDPVVAAAVLYRDHGRAADDATVLVVQDVRRGEQ